MSGNAQGALWLLASCLLGVIINVGARLLQGQAGAMEITFVRFFVALLVTIPFVVSKGGWTSLRTVRWKLHVGRGIFGVLSAFLGFYALINLPLTVCTVLFFTTPIFVTLLAIPMLGEKVGWRRWSASIVGFIGTVIVVNPSPDGVDPAVFVAIGSAAAFSFVLLFGKQLSVTERPAILMIYFAVFTTVASAPAAAFVWTWPSATALLIMLAIGTSGALQMYTDIKGYAAGDVSAISPVQYVRIIFIAIAAYAIFDERLTWNTAVGATVIIASAVYIAHREAKLARLRRRTTADPPAGA